MSDSAHKHTFRVGPEWTDVHATAFIAQGAVVVGDVAIGAESSVWFGAVLRGDTEAIRIGERSNVQDGAVLHADPSFPCLIGDGVTIGHRAIVHGCVVGASCTIGMGAIVMNGAKVGERCMVAAGAVVVGNRDYPAEHLLVGAPARAVRPLRPEEIADLAESAAHYVAASRAFVAAGHDTPRAG